jgi:hypothetical protein
MPCLQHSSAMRVIETRGSGASMNRPRKREAKRKRKKLQEPDALDGRSKSRKKQINVSPMCPRPPVRNHMPITAQSRHVPAPHHPWTSEIEPQPVAVTVGNKTVT